MGPFNEGGSYSQVTGEEVDQRPGLRVGESTMITAIIAQERKKEVVGRWNYGSGRMSECISKVKGRKMIMVDTCCSVYS